MFKVVMEKDGIKKDLQTNMTEDEAYEFCIVFDGEYNPTMNVGRTGDWCYDDPEDWWTLSVEEEKEV